LQVYNVHAILSDGQWFFLLEIWLGQILRIEVRQVTMLQKKLLFSLWLQRGNLKLCGCLLQSMITVKHGWIKTTWWDKSVYKHWEISCHIKCGFSWLDIHLLVIDLWLFHRALTRLFQLIFHCFLDISTGEMRTWSFPAWHFTLIIFYMATVFLSCSNTFPLSS
jgi:hypothetical protein